MRRRQFTAAAATAVAAIGGNLTAASTAAARDGREGPDDLPAQFRGAWIASVRNLDWPSRTGLSAAEQRSELESLLDTAVRHRLNAVLLQVRPTADAMWPSRFEPWSQYLTGTQGQDPGWDPLGFAVDAAHRRGLELHAWFNPYRVSLQDDLGKLAPRHPARRHPEWVVRYAGQLYYNPGLPQVRHFVEAAMLDAVARYPVDGVHWDDYFYPYPVAGEEFDDDEAYDAYGSGFGDRGDWRRHNTELLVRETAARVRRTRPRARFGISPFGVWRNLSTDPQGSHTSAGTQSYDDLYADSRGWVRKRLIDYICPQLYWNIGLQAADYAELVPWWAEVVAGTGVHLYVGEALYREGAAGQPAAWQDPRELSRHLTLDEEWREVLGNVFFSARDVAADPIGAMRRVVEDHYPTRARVPH
ncbi:glycoside hydrolase family 10 protein [Streptomyces humicola]